MNVFLGIGLGKPLRPASNWAAAFNNVYLGPVPGDRALGS